MENISGDDDIQMKNRPHGHVITCSCDVSDSYRCRLKALFNIKPPKQEKPFGGNLVSAGTVWISLDEECGSIKSSGVTYIRFTRVLSGVRTVKHASHGTVVNVDGSVVSSRNDLRASAVVLHAPYLQMHLRVSVFCNSKQNKT